MDIPNMLRMADDARRIRERLDLGYVEKLQFASSRAFDHPAMEANGLVERAQEWSSISDRVREMAEGPVLAAQTSLLGSGVAEAFAGMASRLPDESFFPLAKSVEAYAQTFAALSSRLSDESLFPAAKRAEAYVHIGGALAEKLAADSATFRTLTGTIGQLDRVWGTESQIGSLLAGLAIPAWQVDALRDSFPAVPDQDATPNTLSRWRLEVTQWFLDAIGLVKDNPNAVGALVGIALSVFALIDSRASEERTARRIEASEGRTAERVEGSEERTAGRVESLRQSLQRSPVSAFTARPAGVYETANSKSKRVARLPKGVAVTVLECYGRWCRVEYQDRSADLYQQGWMYKARLAFLGPRP